MLFNSFEFPIFLAIVFLLYWFVFNKNLKAQNFLIVVASYVFYGWWDWRFLGLIFFSSICDFLIGLNMERQENERNRKGLLILSLVINLGILGFFKYFNFFVDSFIDLFSVFGYSIDSWTLRIILPVGISFYTFQTLSYTIDVYRRELKATNDIVSFFAFVSFFPQLVAGPIERATNLLPQILKERSFDPEEAKDGLRQILWGLAKKVLIADSCASIANFIFANHDTQSATTLILGAVFFAFQIYGDFSGYSDVAIGTSRLFGFKLMKNFAFPYFSRDVGEFWRRWHISLSTWFRDYLYIPLGGSRVKSLWLKLRNVFAIFLVSGFWHGANWTFVFWGGLNAFYFIPLFISKNNRRYMDIVANDRMLPTFSEVFRILTTFIIICIAWVFFRAESMTHAFEYLQNIILPNKVYSKPTNAMLKTLAYIGVLLTIEWLQRRKDHGFDRIGRIPVIIRWPVYIFLLYHIINAILGGNEEFIYFQF